MSRALLQRGDVQGALAHLDAPRDDTDALLVASAGAEALVLAAAGQPERAVALTDRANALPVGSYLDHLESWMARGLACAQLGDEACAREACATALALADGTESPLDQALARLAHAHVLAAIEDSEADDAGDLSRRVEVRAVDGRHPAAARAAGDVVVHVRRGDGLALLRAGDQLIDLRG